MKRGVHFVTIIGVIWTSLGPLRVSHDQLGCHTAPESISRSFEREALLFPGTFFRYAPFDPSGTQNTFQVLAVMTRRQFLIGGSAAAALGISWWRFGRFSVSRDQPVASQTVDPQTLLSQLKTHMTQLADQWATSSNELEKQREPLLRYSVEHLVISDTLVRESPMGVSFQSNPDGSLIVGPNGHVEFELNIQAESVNDLLNSKNPVLLTILNSLLVKEIGGVEDITPYPFIGRSRRMLYDIVQRRLKEINNQVTNEILDHTAFSEIIKRYTALYLRTESIGYIRMLEYLATQGQTPVSLRRAVVGSQTRNLTSAVIENFADMLERIPADNPDRIWRGAQYHYQAVLGVVKPGDIQRDLFYIALLVEAAEGRAQILTDGSVGIPIDQNTSWPPVDFLGYIRDPNYFAPTPESILEIDKGPTQRSALLGSAA